MWICQHSPYFRFIPFPHTHMHTHSHTHSHTYTHTHSHAISGPRTNGAKTVKVEIAVDECKVALICSFSVVRTGFGSE